jgi:hypothetical protein
MHGSRGLLEKLANVHRNIEIFNQSESRSFDESEEEGVQPAISQPHHFDEREKQTKSVAVVQTVQV